MNRSTIQSNRALERRYRNRRWNHSIQSQRRTAPEGPARTTATARNSFEPPPINRASRTISGTTMKGTVCLNVQPNVYAGCLRGLRYFEDRRAGTPYWLIVAVLLAIKKVFQPHHNLACRQTWPVLPDGRGNPMLQKRVHMPIGGNDRLAKGDDPPSRSSRPYSPPQRPRLGPAHTRRRRSPCRVRPCMGRSHSLARPSGSPLPGRRLPGTRPTLASEPIGPRGLSPGCLGAEIRRR
jgi:hypothetical protein